MAIKRYWSSNECCSCCYQAWKRGCQCLTTCCWDGYTIQDSSNTVQQNADNVFKTAKKSANEHISRLHSFLDGISSNSLSLVLGVNS